MLECTFRHCLPCSPVVTSRAQNTITTPLSEHRRSIVASFVEWALLEVFEMEAQDRKERRIDRLRRASGLPPAKTFDTLDMKRLPRELAHTLRELARGEFVDRAENVLAFGLPGVGKTHACYAIGHALINQGRSVFRLVQDLLVARRDLLLPRALRKLDLFDVLLLDYIGYVQQNTEEVEVLCTLMAERYERRSMVITSNLMFSQ